MYAISAAQIKAARALLGISREALADATKLSTATIRNLEKGFVSYRSTETVRLALEAAGIEFSEDDGVRRRSNELRILRGQDSASLFYEDLMETMKGTGGEIAIVMKSQDFLLQSCGIPPSGRMDKINKLADHAEIRCILTEGFDLPFSIPETEYRTISKGVAGPVPYFIYGKKCALVLPYSDMSFKFVIFQTHDIARCYLQHFEVLWQSAAPLIVQRSEAPRMVAV